MTEKVLFPIGRLLWGSLYTPVDKDYHGQPLTVKTPGPDFGKPDSKFQFGVGIPKTPGKQWWEEPWGQAIVREAQAGFPRGEHQRPEFAWKVKDGDSAALSKKTQKPLNSMPGNAGHWIVTFSSKFPPKITAENGTKQLVDKDAVKNGYYVQVYANVSANGNPNNPGVFVNHDTVNFSAYGEGIVGGIDPATIGFGGALPQGASAAPTGGNFNPAAIPAAPAMPGVPATPGMAPAVPATPMVPGAAVVPSVPGAVPAPAMPTPAPAAPQPPAAPAAPAVQVKMMVPGCPYTYDQLKGQGWSDQNMIDHGYLQPIATPAGVTPVPSFLG